MQKAAKLATDTIHKHGDVFNQIVELLLDKHIVGREEFLKFKKEDAA